MRKSNHMYVEALEHRQHLSSAPWGGQATLIGLDKVVSQFPQLNGSGQTVAVIDSGVDYNHPSLGGGLGRTVIGGWDYVNNDSTPMSDSNPHGTGVASMIAASGYDFKGYHYQGIAAGAKIVALRQSNSYGVDNALKWVIANKSKFNITAVNITDFGGGSLNTYKSIQASLAKLTSLNVFISSPSGNGGAYTSAGWRDPNEAVVGSVNKSGGISSFTQRGSSVDYMAPGEDVSVAYYNPSTKQHMYVDTGDGTSWAAPQLSAAATLLRQIKPSFTNGEIRSILSDSGVKTYDSVSKITYPRLNLYSAVLLAYQRAGKPVNPVTPPPTTTPVTPTTPTAPSGTLFTTPTPIGASAVLQAENFNAGLEGQAYHDVEAKNIGTSTYRNTGVDLSNVNDGGAAVAVVFTKAGEWIRYDVNVEATGTYTVDFRLAALGAGGAAHLEVDGVNVTGSMAVPDTGAWTTYQTFSKTGINMTAGKHTLRIVFDKAGSSGYVCNYNWMKFTRTSTVPTSTPFKTHTVALGTATQIEAEDFDLGAEGLAYHDTEAANLAGQYRQTGVDIEKTLDTGGGYDVGYLKAGEWLKYTVDVTKGGTFNLDARVASGVNGASFHVEVDGKNVTGAIALVNTGGFQKWTSIRKSGIALAAGKHTIRIVVDSSGGYPYAGNINWIKLS